VAAAIQARTATAEIILSSPMRTSLFRFMTVEDGSNTGMIPKLGDSRTDLEVIQFLGDG